jgi:hypothetical protein
MKNKSGGYVTFSRLFVSSGLKTSIFMCEGVNASHIL